MLQVIEQVASDTPEDVLVHHMDVVTVLSRFEVLFVPSVVLVHLKSLNFFLVYMEALNLVNA